MPVDQKTLDEAIAEATAGDAELAALLKERFAKNDAAAVAFTGGFTRTKDYTQKTQSAAEEKRLAAEAKAKADEQVALYRQQLEDSEGEKAKILRDLANQKITAAQANARLQHVKEIYALPDEDIPPMGDLIETRKSGKVVDSTPDIDDRLKAFKEEVRKDIMDNVTKQLIPELGGLAAIPITWSDINGQHQELTGKRLTAKEQQEILQTAADQKKSLMQVWEEKHNIADLRQTKHDEGVIARERDKWEKEAAAKRSEEAMQGIRPGVPDEAGLRLSPVLQKQFKPREDGQAAQTDRKFTSANQREKLSGAERAAKDYLERRAAGIPMGKPNPAKKTA